MDLYHTIKQVQHDIRQAEENNARIPGSVLLLAVSKNQPAQAIKDAFELGLTDFGESYLQEAQHKMAELAQLPLCWHFIGPIQSNKTKAIARQFNWVHSLNRLIVARLLDEYRSIDLAPLNVCLQINLVHEESKSGIDPEEAVQLARDVSRLPHLKLRGLMTIPPPQKSPQQQYELFMQLNQLLQRLNQELGLNMDTLSMGMSDDLIPAIKAGATIVRVGRALFGERKSIPNTRD